MNQKHEASPITGADRRRATARRNSQMQAERTIERLAEGIAALSRKGVPIGAKVIEREAGLSYRTIARNAGAYVLFCKHAAYFQPKLQSKIEAKQSHKATLKRRTPRQRTPAGTPWDPLLGQTKRKLVERVRAAERQIAELQQALANLAAGRQEVLAHKLMLQAELVVAARKLAK